MSRQKTAAVGLTALTLLLAFAPTGWAGGDRDPAARDARQIVREDRITAHQIQVESKSSANQSRSRTILKTTNAQAPLKPLPPKAPRR